MAEPAKGLDLKKKIGPLPLWSWIVIIGGTVGIFLLYKHNSSTAATGSSASTSSTEGQVDPNNPLGLTYAQESSDIAEGVDPNTGESYAAEQTAADAANASGDGGVSGGSGDASTGTTDDSVDEPTWASDLDTDVTTLTSTLQGGGLTDGSTETPGEGFGQEITDVTGAISALGAAGLLGTATPATAAPSASPTATASQTKVTKTQTTTSPTVVKAASKALSTGSDGVKGGTLKTAEALNKVTTPKIPVVTVSAKKTTAKGK